MRGWLARSAFLQWARLNPMVLAEGPPNKDNIKYIPRPFREFSYPALLQAQVAFYHSPCGLLLYRRQKICADQLERRGFYIAKGVRRLAMSTKNKIRASQSWEDVFNGMDRDGNLTYDGSRKQTRGNEPWHEEVLPLLEADFRALGVLACSDGREKALSRLVSLKSTRCRTKGKQHQPRHADSAPKDSLRGELPHDVPLAALLAIQGRTRLHVWPFDTDKEEIVELEDGDLLIFRGDLGHAGAEYNEEDMHGGVHLRLHVYIDSPLIERQMDSDGVPLTFPF